jgi:hypothetical protein
LKGDININQLDKKGKSTSCEKGCALFKIFLAYELFVRRKWNFFEWCRPGKKEV